MERAYVFDKVRFHLESVRARGLPDHQAGVHLGLFFGWAVDRGLVARWVEDGAPDAFAAYRRREITGPALLAACDGALLDDQLTDEGLGFVAVYYPPRTGRYLQDYVDTLAGGLPSEFHVRDDPANADKLAQVLDARLAEWRATRDPSAGRPDLRQDRPAPAPLPDTLVLPVLPVTGGVVLPHGSIGVRLARADSLAALAAAEAADRRLALVPTGPDDPVDPGVVGVVAEIERAEPAGAGPRSVVLACLARVTLAAWVRPGVGRFELEPEPEPTPDDLERLDRIRVLAADLVRRRIDRGVPPGLLALCAGASPAALLDLVARELPATREEQLTVLASLDLETRAMVVEALLARAR